MILNIILLVLFSLIFNWSVNLQILAQVEKNKRDKLIAIVMAVFGSLLLGVIVVVR